MRARQACALLNQRWSGGPTPRRGRLEGLELPLRTLTHGDLRSQCHFLINQSLLTQTKNSQLRQRVDVVGGLQRRTFSGRRRRFLCAFPPVRVLGEPGPTHQQERWRMHRPGPRVPRAWSHCPRRFRRLGFSAQSTLCLDPAVVSHLIHQIVSRVCQPWLWAPRSDAEGKKENVLGHVQAVARAPAPERPDLVCAAQTPPSMWALVPRAMRAALSRCIYLPGFTLAPALKPVKVRACSRMQTPGKRAG